MKYIIGNRVTSLFLSLLLVIFQSCNIYKSSSITLEEASLINKKVKVQTAVGEKLIFKHISKEEEIYYGVKKKKGELVKTPLNQDYIAGIYPKAKVASIVFSVVFPVAIISGLLLIFMDGSTPGDIKGS